MAWPLTRRTTYVNASPPPIDAADLNALQDFAGASLRGEYTFKGLVIDGAGGAATTATARKIEITGGAGTISTPDDGLTLSVAPGTFVTINKGLIVQTTGISSTGGITELNGDISTVANFNGHRLIGNGTKIVIGDVSDVNNFGGAGSCTAVLGTDLACEVEITCNTTGAPAGAPGNFKLTYTDGTFTTPPMVFAQLVASNDANALGRSVFPVATATDVTVSIYGFTPSNGLTYTFRILSLGRPA